MCEGVVGNVRIGAPIRLLLNQRSTNHMANNNKKDKKKKHLSYLIISLWC